MNSSLTTIFAVDQAPEQVFAAITNVRGWWSGEIDGSTDTLGAEFTYCVPDVHFSKFRIMELVPAKKVAWLVLDSYLSFTEDKEEWTGTTVVFDIVEQDGRTHVRFTHEGLVPDHQCYDACSTAWGVYVNESLRSLINTGAGQPNSFQGEAALEVVRAKAARD